MSQQDESAEEKSEGINDGKKRTKEERTKIAKNALLQSLYSGKIDSVSEKVALVLKLNTKARNSEVDLYWEFWKTFESNLLSDQKNISYEEMVKLTRPMSLTRMRAKIQNEFHLFEAEDAVKKRRGTLEDEKKAEMLEFRASFPVFSVFADESGKVKGDYLIIGSLWFSDANAEMRTVHKIRECKDRLGIKHEFHFAELSPNQVPLYKDFFNNLIQDNHSLSFKAAIVKKAGVKNIHNALFHLTLYLLREGILHEDSSGNAKLPRRIEVSFDSENLEADRLRLSSIKSILDVQINAGTNRLRCESFEPVESGGNYLIQGADIFAASLNRRLNERPERPNHKDILSEYIFEHLGIVDYDPPNVSFENNAVKIFSLDAIQSDDVIVT